MLYCKAEGNLWGFILLDLPHCPSQVELLGLRHRQGKRLTAPVPPSSWLDCFGGVVDPPAVLLLGHHGSSSFKGLLSTLQFFWSSPLPAWLPHPIPTPIGSQVHVVHKASHSTATGTVSRKFPSVPSSLTGRKVVLSANLCCVSWHFLQLKSCWWECGRAWVSNDPRRNF